MSEELDLRCQWCGAKAAWWFRGRGTCGFACDAHHSRYMGMPFNWQHVNDLTRAGVLGKARDMVLIGPTLE